MTLLDAARGAAELIRTAPGTIEIVARPCADGIAGAAALVSGLLACGRPFHVRFASDPRPDPLEAEPRSRVLVGHPDRDALLAIDHREDGAPRPRLVSGRPLGLAAPEACCATLALAVASQLHPSANRLAPVALAGAWSEGQGRPSFSGWNAQVLEAAIQAKTVTTRPGLLFDDRPLLELFREPSPLFEGVALTPDAAATFLGRWGLPVQATVHELDARHAQRLATALALRHLQGPSPPADLSRWFGPIPWDAARDLPVPRLASLLQRAAQKAECGLALAYVLGEDQARSELEDLATVPPTLVSPP